MRRHDPAVFHKMFGEREPRIAYYKRDFLDYTVMVLLTALVAAVSYGGHVLSIISVALCAWAIVTFALRHGVELRIPLLLRRPQDVLYMFGYKLQNMTPLYGIALGVLLLENIAIRMTPGLPHHVALMRTIAFYLFYMHLIGITLFRTAILVDHIAKKALVREILMQTPWRRIVNERTNMTLEVVHAYCTGVLTHIILLSPWYLVIKYADFSVVFLVPACAINIFIHAKWMRAINAWFYRDHWLGHNSELEFIYLHGTHHDAIPSGLLAVSENGFLEGVLRLTIGAPVTFYSPLIAFLVFTVEIVGDINGHQYIPGVFPRLPRELLRVAQHATHHYGPLEPYSFGIKVDQPESGDAYKDLFRGLPDELRNSAKLDEELTGFVWDNPTYRHTQGLYDKYHVDRHVRVGAQQ